MADFYVTASFNIIEGQPMDVCWGRDLHRGVGGEIKFRPKRKKEHLIIEGRKVPLLYGDEMPQDPRILVQHGASIQR